jgi:hypothetical protein
VRRWLFPTRQPLSALTPAPIPSRLHRSPPRPGLSQRLVPTEYPADAVVPLVDRKPVFGIILEAQLQLDHVKDFTWPSVTTIGLRNLTGVVNLNTNTVTLWATTSTSSTSGDNGADPNKT